MNSEPLSPPADLARPEPGASGPDQLATPARWPLATALVLALAGCVTTVLLWQRLQRTEEALTRRAADTQILAAQARESVSQAETLVSELQARLGVAEVRLSEVSLQRSQLDELMLSVSRSRDDSLVQDLESALRLAMQQSQLTGSVQPLISALQVGAQRIERASQPRLNPVQRAMTRDVERLRTASTLDTPALLQRIDEVLRQVETLPLRNGIPAHLDPTPVGRAVVPEAGVPTPRSEEVDSVRPEVGGAPSWRQRWWVWGESWQTRWNRWMQQLRSGVTDLVRISRIDQPEAALLTPDQSYFLREHLKLWLLNARMGLLARQIDTAQNDVRSAQGLLQRYFDVSATPVQAVLRDLERMQLDLHSEGLPRPDDTLAALAVAANGR